MIGHPRMVRGQPRIVKNSAINRKTIGVIYTLANLGRDAKGKQYYFNDIIELFVAYLISDPERFNDFTKWAFGIELIKEEDTGKRPDPDTPKGR